PRLDSSPSFVSTESEEHIVRYPDDAPAPPKNGSEFRKSMNRFSERFKRTRITNNQSSEIQEMMSIGENRSPNSTEMMNLCDFSYGLEFNLFGFPWQSLAGGRRSSD